MTDADYRFEEVVSDSIYIAERATGLGVVFEGVKRLLWLASRGLYVFPVLALVKLVWRGEGSDLITLAFVALVVGFFALLALFLALFPLVGPRSSRRKERRFAPPRTLDEALHALHLDAVQRGLPVALGGNVEGAGPLCITGTLQRLDARGAPTGRDVFQDTWIGTDKRAFVGARFAVVTAGGPALVEVRGPMVCVGRYTTGQDGSRTLVFHDGDEVQLVAREYSVTEHVEGWSQGGDPAYRGGPTPGLQVVCWPGSPVVIAAARG